jgi:peptidoglycan/LPS O-acetylase OafA/YrhL
MRLEFEQKADVSFGQFYLRRAFRILPPFYLVLAVAYAVTLAGLVEGDVGLGGALAQLFHVTNYYIVFYGWWEGLAPGTWVYWSLAVEEHFYVVFPLAYLWSRRRFGGGGRQAGLLFALCLLILAWRCLLIFGFDAAKERTYVATDTRIDSIIAGCILAVWHNPIFPKERLDDRRLARIWLPIGIAMVVASVLPRVHWFDQTLRYTLQSFGLMPCFMAAIRWHDRFPFRLLDSAVMRKIGLYSYSLYLMHTSALWAMENYVSLPEIVRGLMALVLLIGVAALMYRYVEKPASSLRKRVSKRLAAASGVALIPR